jgi:hypothetical protein
MTIIEANKEIEKIDNELEYWINKKEIVLQDTIYPPSPDPALERVEGGKRTDKYKHLDYAIDEIDPIIDKLYKEKRILEEYIEKELIRLGKYNEIEQLIVFYKEQTTENYTWLQISQRVHYSVTQCRRIYRKFKKQREI